jgi:type III secretion protein R
MNSDSLNLLQIVFLGIGLGFLPYFIVVATSFTKISIVLFLVRNALGLQQAPSNLVIQAIALSLTVFICAPLFERIYEAVSAPGQRFQTSADFIAVGQKVREPLAAYLERHSKPDTREFLVSTTAKLWPDGRRPQATPKDLNILIPAFTIAELQRAFEIGFLLSLPFLVVDLVVTTILIAMGLSQVTPTIISIPVKIFIFVAVDGWSRLLNGLILSYV